MQYCVFLSYLYFSSPEYDTTEDVDTPMLAKYVRRNFSTSSNSSSSSSRSGSGVVDLIDITSCADGPVVAPMLAGRTVVEKSKEKVEKRFNKRELDFTAEPLDYVAVYPAADQPTEGYRFWIARAQESISYEQNRKKKVPVVYFAAKGNTDYLHFEQESPKKVKIHFAMLLGRVDSTSVVQVSESQITLSKEERDKWSVLAKQLDEES